MVKVNVEARKIGILREQIFSGRICRVRKECIRIECAPDLYELLDKFNHSARAEPTRHRAGDFVANEVTEDCRMPGMRLNGSTNIFGDLFTCGSFTEELDVFFSRKSYQNAHPRGSA